MKVYSFDVFDTCVVRCYPRPTDLFYPARQRDAGPKGQRGVR